MIETVSIENFQSLKKAHLVFGTFNCIIGPSDSGKSAFIRALRACMSARRSFDFATFGCDHVTVGVGFSDRTAIIWRRTKSSGKYSIRHEGKTLEFSKYGHSCPQEVTDIAKLGSIAVDEQVSFNPNFSSQFDSLFLISERGSVIAKILSTVTNANNLLLAVREANLVAGKRATELKVFEEQVVEFDEQIQGLDWLGETGKQIEAVQQALDKAAEKYRFIERLRDHQGKLAQEQLKITECNAEIAVIQNVLDLCDKALVCEEKARALTVLKKLHGNTLRRTKQYEAALTGLEITAKQIDIIDKCGEGQERLAELQTLQRLEGRADENYCLHRDALQDCQRIGCEIGVVADEMEEFDNCPLCGNFIGNKNGA